MKYISIDIETTGLDPDMHDIVEFGAIIDDLDDDSPSHPIFHCYFEPPFNGNFIGSPYALSMHAEKFERIAHPQPGNLIISPKLLGDHFRDWLLVNSFEYNSHGSFKVSIVAAGKNFGSFDLQFLKRKSNLLDFVDIHYRMIDPCILYYEPGDIMLPSMDKCLERAGIDKTVTHNAVDDAMDIVKLIRHKMRS